MQLLVIACLGQTTPVACITYQNKFEEPFQHFNLENVTIPPEKAFQPGELVRFITEVLARRKEIQNQIRTVLPHVQHLSAANFANVTA